jgi:anti-sigma factor RsiW
MATEYGCAAARADLGVYLLGALEPAGRAEVEEHFQACSRCRDQLAALAALPALLRRVADDQAVLGEPGSAARPEKSGPDQLIHEVRRRRRRTRALGAVAVAGLVAATAATATIAATSRAQPPAAAWSATAQATSSATGVWAEVRYAPRAWGTEVEARLTGVRPGTRCQLWVTEAGRQRTAAGGWTIVSSRGVVWYPASVPLAAATVRDFQITTQAGSTLASIHVPPRSPGTHDVP